MVGNNIPATQFITQPTGQIQLIASPNPQGMNKCNNFILRLLLDNLIAGMGYVSQGVMPHKTIIIVQNGSGGNPITLTVR